MKQNSVIIQKSKVKQKLNELKIQINKHCNTENEIECKIMNRI